MCVHVYKDATSGTKANSEADVLNWETLSGIDLTRYLLLLSYMVFNVVPCTKVCASAVI